MKPWMWWSIPVIGTAAFFALKPKARARSIDDLLGDDEGPITTQTAEDPTAAAQSLADYLTAGGLFGTAAYPSEKVAEVQRVLQVADDGIVGEITRRAANKYGVQLPARAQAASGDWQVVIGEATLTDGASAAGATEPEPAEVARTPRESKGSLVAIATVQLSGLARMADKGDVVGAIRQNVGGLGAKTAQCPDAPTLKGSPSISANSLGGGRWEITIRWAGTWRSAGMPAGLKRCLTTIATGTPGLSDVLVGLQVRRS